MRLLCLLVTTAASLVCVSPAFAATVAVDEEPHKFTFTAVAGEVNQITLAEDGLGIVVTDTGEGTVTPGAGCTLVTADSVRCALASGEPFNVVQVDLGDQDDHATITGGLDMKLDGEEGNDVLTGGDAGDDLDGGPGDDRLEGRGGRDEVHGLAGADVILVRDGAVDDVTCGLDADSVEADVEDTTDAECETVDRPLAALLPLTGGDGAKDGDNGNHYGQTKDRDEAGKPVVAGPPVPVPGRSVAVKVKKGTILVKRPGVPGWSPLDPTQPLPVGTVLDARRGTLTMTAASTSTGGTPASADFTGAQFAVRQIPGRVLTTELRMTGGDFSVCGTAAASRTTAYAAGDRKKRAVRKLWGSGHGRFKTRGRNSAATVRGTIWTVVDRCDGTLTKVTRGVVVVRDFTRGRTKVVRAGQSYLAPRKRSRRP